MKASAKYLTRVGPFLLACSFIGFICWAPQVAAAEEFDYRPLSKRAQLSDESFCYQAWKDENRWHGGDPLKQIGLDHCWDFMSLDGKRWVGLKLSKDKKAEMLGVYQLWYLSAHILGGDTEAMYYVAREARVARVGDGNMAKSIELTTKAAKRGHAKAQYVLGLHYAQGLGVNQDYFDAQRWLKKSAANGDTDAKVYLAYMYEYGKGVKKDRKQAERLYRQAAGVRHPVALASIERINRPEVQVAKKTKKEAITDVAQGSVGEGGNQAVSQRSSNSEHELEFWRTIKDSNEPDMYREYLRQFPGGLYAGLARLKIKKLGGDPTDLRSAIPNLDYGDYHALVIGNNQYDNLKNLHTAVNDARAVANLLEVDYGFSVTVLENASRSSILRGLSKLRKNVSKKDNILIYYAGHGYLDQAADEGFWLPSDAERIDQSNWILTDRITSQVKAMEAKHVMVVADSCFSGTITRALKIEQRTPSYLQKIVNTKSRTALTSGGLEPVLDTGGGRHSIFASSFISLLEENEGVMDGSQLFSALREKVMVNAHQTPEYGNIHQAGHDGGDFLFVKR